jgi:hypothetical protein
LNVGSLAVGWEESPPRPVAPPMKTKLFVLAALTFASSAARASDQALTLAIPSVVPSMRATARISVPAGTKSTPADGGQGLVLKGGPGFSMSLATGRNMMLGKSAADSVTSGGFLKDAHVEVSTDSLLIYNYKNDDGKQTYDFVVQVSGASVPFECRNVSSGGLTFTRANIDAMVKACKTTTQVK